MMNEKITALVKFCFGEETLRLTQKRLCETVRAIASLLKKCPNKLDIMTFCTYIYSNSTRHASRQISVPGRVFYFIGLLYCHRFIAKRKGFPVGKPNGNLGRRILVPLSRVNLTKPTCLFVLGKHFTFCEGNLFNSKIQ
ncbi:MAG: hypothetical protein ACE362_11510 [Phaeodactylibacter xiamenensis]|uniref:Uncharacterized protein n=1 Tax=Phaeodactylibacter xiamenensis TaxID=1524460 RepID=A0A098S511_9BACT|nr:hypothetical protein [Phaeodactylibacter xiamenensis]KGE86863.1 hypothetical protein IX84_17510 [Phaeodactylibacter xiamenensis]MCR9052991.1 hypothetical protein [bacterium]